ncbi:aminoglycoside phosphotransferase family protein [Ureibacillus sp. 179-F W5.1 NHS]|uniref:Aminoglycoside phosphotransferase family protein n=1 Tax=Lysinibacillus halotolerans TaxID=1368476 RepID=A0A3M8HBB2_9BACI|nr:aminoglycoside phosphotransferase family protein [Lysinibacillus halotolerans]RNC99666.1 aminoglycoside phosphotransferase family protein [Lysinibacillus halotolerans]
MQYRILHGNKYIVGGNQLESNLIKRIDYLKNADSILPLTKGFSNDQKFVIDQRFLLRIFPMDQQVKRKIEFDTIHQLSSISECVPKTIEFNHLEDLNKCYMIVSFLPGKDAEEALKELTTTEQYDAGYMAGNELGKLHQLVAPSHYPSWDIVKKKKSDYYLLELKNINIDENIKQLLESYIKENEDLMIGRPNTFQHDDFHPSNLLIKDKTFAGIIDFERMDWGDPIHDLQKLGFFSKQVSVEFTRGVIAGYLAGQTMDSSYFWKLYALYSAMHIVSSLVWGLKSVPETFDILLKHSLEVLEDHDNFKNTIPKWYLP